MLLRATRCLSRTVAMEILLFQQQGLLEKLLFSSGVAALDEMLGGDGYPDKCSVLIIGPPSVSKEALGYWFTNSGLVQNDFCIYVTRLSSKEVLEDTKAFGMDLSQRVPLWYSRDEGVGHPQFKFDMNDLTGFSFNLKEIIKNNSDRRIRIVLDVLSSLLMLNTPESIYRLLTQLFAEIKQYDVVLLAYLEEGMHPPQVLAAMQQLFDGFIELSLFKEGLRILPLIRIGKMRGMNPMQDYNTFSFTRTGAHFERAFFDEVFPKATQTMSRLQVESATTNLLEGEVKVVFDFLSKCFTDDYKNRRLAIEQSGWRTRVAIEGATGVARASLYGANGKFGPIVKEIISKGLVETRFFPGQRGRGGEVIKLRIAYEKEFVRRLAEATDPKGASAVGGHIFNER
jgi:KaiC/GvpD/RAD55 family RecA-like ATPase